MPIAAWAVAAALLAGIAAGAPEPGAAEARLAAAIAAREPAARTLLRRLVDINSGTMNFAGVREVGAALRVELDALGFATRWVDGAPFGRAGHLVAERHPRAASPERAPRVLLIGHLDTVFEHDSPFQGFELLPGDRARGPGTTDMKGGDVVMLLALQSLADAGRLDALDLTVVLTGDEESSGSPKELARADLEAAGEWADVALGFEDGDGRFESAVVARRGTSDWRLEVSGRPAHSSLVFRADTGPGAIFEAARILDAFRRELAGEEYLTFNPGVLVGGTAAELDRESLRGTAFGKTNVVAGATLVEGDLRTLSPEQLERTRRRMREIVDRHLPHTGARLTFGDGYAPMAPTDGNRRLLGLFDQVSRDLDMGAVTATDPMQAGAADISFVAAKVEMALDGIGLKGTGGHTVEETADLATLGKQAKRVAVLLHRLPLAP